MSFSNKLLKVSAFLSVVSMSIIPASAKTDRVLEMNNTRNTTSLEFVKSPDKLDLVLDNGDLVSLPKFDKVVSVNPFVSVKEQKIKVIDVKAASKTIKEKAVLTNELKNLSSKLGIKIKDASNINLYREIADWMGTRYRRGGMNRSGVDCSGFTNIIYNEVFDKKLDRVSTDIANNLKKSLPVEKLNPGDLVFFATNRRKQRINHIGVYIGEGRFAHASCKHGVIVSDLTEGYYSKTYRKSGRVE